MTYRVEFTPRAWRHLKKVPLPYRSQVTEYIDALALDPRPPQCEQLRNQHGWYRVRAGDYRVVYELHDGELLVLIVALGHRRDIYQLLDRE